MVSDEIISVKVTFEPHGERVIPGRRTVKLHTLRTALDIHPHISDGQELEHAINSSQLSDISFDLPVYSQEFIYNTLLQKDFEHHQSEIIAQKIAMAIQERLMNGVQEFFMTVGVHITNISIIDDESYVDTEEFLEESEDGSGEAESEQAESEDDESEDEESEDEEYREGVTEEAMKKLQRIKGADLNRDKNEECLICLERFSGVCEIVKMPCSHLFHESCIFKWLQNKSSCPLCRIVVS